jgi:NlpC/P60 family
MAQSESSDSDWFVWHTVGSGRGRDRGVRVGIRRTHERRRSLCVIALSATFLTGVSVSIAPLRSVAQADTASSIVTAAESLHGQPYVLGGGHGGSPGPSGGGIDCSGLVRYAVYEATGIDLDRTADQQWAWAQANPSQATVINTNANGSNLQPGDIVFFKNLAGGDDHTGIWVGSHAYDTDSAGWSKFNYPANHAVINAYGDDGLGVVYTPINWWNSRDWQVAGAYRMSSGGSGGLGEGTRFTESGQTQQYVVARGTALPLSVGDAEAFDSEGDSTVVTDTSNFAAGHPASGFPDGSVVRVVGTPSQFLYLGAELHPIDAPATSSCLLFIYDQSSPTVVPTMWSDTNTTGAGVPCSLPGGTRFIESGSTQQYVAWAGSSLPLSYADGQAFDADGDVGVATMASGYVSGHPASTFPNDTVVRVVGSISQYLYQDGELRPIDAPATSSCLLYRYGQTQVDVVPTMWSDTIPVSAGVPCSLPDGTRFLESGSSQQYISWSGASLPVSYADAQAYVAEGNTGVATMADGYVSGHPASGFPSDNVVRVVGGNPQFLYGGGSLHSVGTPAMSACLLAKYGKQAVDVVPSMWSDTVPSGSPATCGTSSPHKGKVVVSLRHDGSPVNGEWVCLANHRTAQVTDHRTNAGSCHRTVHGKATLTLIKPGRWHVLRIKGSRRWLSGKTATVTAGKTSHFIWKV